MFESVGNALEKRWCSFIRAKEKSPETLTVSGLFCHRVAVLISQDFVQSSSVGNCLKFIT